MQWLETAREVGLVWDSIKEDQFNLVCQGQEMDSRCPSRDKGRSPDRERKNQIQYKIPKVRFSRILHPPPVEKIKVSSPWLRWAGVG